VRLTLASSALRAGCPHGAGLVLAAQPQAMDRPVVRTGTIDNPFILYSEQQQGFPIFYPFQGLAPTAAAALAVQINIFLLLFLVLSFFAQLYRLCSSGEK
jgi:hypothetical protein